MRARATRGEATRFFDEVVTVYDSDECLIWPFELSPNGYGRMNRRNGTRRVNRNACQVEHGPPPSEDHEAAHSCGVSQCCNKKHLRWATRTENENDKHVHETDNRGDRHGRSKLKESEVREILASRGKETQRVLAERYDISISTVCEILSGKTWCWLHDNDNEFIEVAA